MPRPKLLRQIETPPLADGFKPFGFPMTQLEPVILLYEEYESIRLADYLSLTHAEAAKQMQVSRPTFTRIYEQARKSVAEAFIEGKAILFEGGDYHSDNFWYKCIQCSKLIISTLPAKQCHYCNHSHLRILNRTSHGTPM
jgi:predicted DNA-binding protein (UPF0251 family)